MRPLAIVLSFVVVGCFPVVTQTYAPVGRSEGTTLARNCETKQVTTLFEEHGVTIKLLLYPRGDSFTGSVQVDVPSGKILSLGSSHLTLESPDLQSPLPVQLKGGRYPAGKPIEGFALSEYDIYAALPSQPKNVSVRLPSLSIDGAQYQPILVPYSLQRRPDLVFLCQ